MRTEASLCVSNIESVTIEYVLEATMSNGLRDFFQLHSEPIVSIGYICVEQGLLLSKETIFEDGWRSITGDKLKETIFLDVGKGY